MGLEIGITTEGLAAEFPKLYHMAEEGSWDSIRRHGLLSTSALLDLFEVRGAARTAIESCHRPESVPIKHPVHGTAVIRDQKPMSDKGLEKALLDGLTPRQWYELLNRQVFFWVREQRLRTLLAARAYRDKRHLVLTIDTARLLARHAERIVLSPYNSGATKPNPFPRGRDTFLPMQQYPYLDWRKARGRQNAVVELAVLRGVPDIVEFIERVELTGGARPPQVVWTSVKKKS